MEPCIKYAKYKNSVNIAIWKVHDLLDMAFCHILSKFCSKYSLVFKLLPILGIRPKSHSNMISMFSSCDARSFRANITAYWFDIQSVLTPVPLSKYWYHEDWCLHLKEIWQKYTKMTYVHTCTCVFIFELVDKTWNKYAVTVA